MMDVDVTKEMLELSKAGIDAFREMLKLGGIILLPTGEAAIKAAEKGVKHALEQNGLLSYRDFMKRLGQREGEWKDLPEPLDRELLNETLKNNRIPAFLMDGHPPVLVFPKEDLLGVKIVLKEYEEKISQKNIESSQRSTSFPNMTKLQLESVERNNRQIDEIFNTKGVQTPFMHSLMNSEMKERYNDALQRAFMKDLAMMEYRAKEITSELRKLAGMGEADGDVRYVSTMLTASRAKEMISELENLSGGTVRVGDDGRNIRSVLGKMRLTGNPDMDRQLLAERMKSGMSDSNCFVSLMGDKAVCFIDNDANLNVINLSDCQVKVNKLTPENEERARFLLKTLSERREINRNNLDVMLPKDYPQERRRFLQEMYDRCIMQPELRDEVNLICNYMVNTENADKVTWKDTLLWESVKEGRFDPLMVRMDEEQIAGIYSAKRAGIQQGYIQHMIRAGYTGDQIRGAVDYMIKNGEPPMQELDDFAERIIENQNMIKQTLIYGNIPGRGQGKETLEGVLERAADRRMEEMVQGNVALMHLYDFDAAGKEPDHTDMDGISWYEIYKDQKDSRIFASEDKALLKYEVRVDEEPLRDAEEKRLEEKGAVYTDRKGEQFYEDGQGLVSGKGKRIKQVKTRFDVNMDDITKMQKALMTTKTIENPVQNIGGGR